MCITCDKNFISLMSEVLEIDRLKSNEKKPTGTRGKGRKPAVCRVVDLHDL